MPLRWQEVAVPLAVVLVLVVLKYVPVTAGFPLARLAGIISFGYAIFLALRLVQAEEAVFIDGWSELRPSPLELFGAFGGAAFSGLLLVAVLFGGALGGTPVQVIAAFCLSVLLAAISIALIFQSLLVRVRWNVRVVERRDHKGRLDTLKWADVVKVEGRWRGVTLTTASKQRLSFSPLHSGAAQLAKYAQTHARRNSAAIAKASTVWS